jgi:hypothetical protein
MLRLALSAATILLATVVGLAQPNGGGPGPVIGIVEIPKIFTLDPQSGRYVDGALTLYARADADSPVATTITSREAIDAAEYGYEGWSACLPPARRFLPD